MNGNLLQLWTLYNLIDTNNTVIPILHTGPLSHRKAVTYLRSHSQSCADPGTEPSSLVLQPLDFACMYERDVGLTHAISSSNHVCLCSAWEGSN